MREGAPHGGGAKGVEVVGREDELAAVDAFLRAATRSSACLVLEGSAGIGKTTLWRAGVDAATAAGCIVASCRPVEAEARLAFAGLGDLFQGVDEGVLRGLPEPQWRALAAAPPTTSSTPPCR